MSEMAEEENCPGMCWSAWGLACVFRNFVTSVNMMLIARNQGGKNLHHGN